MADRVRVLIVDDSPLARKVLTDIITSELAFQVVGTANNGKVALAKIPLLKPDVLVLDIVMPELDGFAVLKEVIDRSYDIKVVMISSLTIDGASLALKALDMGAIDFITKPSGKGTDLIDLSEVIIEKVHAASKADIKKVRSDVKLTNDIGVYIKKASKAFKRPKIIVAIGASTGGPNALKDIFKDSDLPNNCAYLIVQHMPEEFTSLFAERLNEMSRVYITEAKDKEPILAGRGYLAPGNAHLEIKFIKGVPYVRLQRSDKVSGHMPSIDVLFNSIARSCADSSVAVILTGMGADGAIGIKSIHNNGGKTIAQDQDSSVVFGMNKEAIENGAIDEVLSLNKIPGMINYFINQKVKL